MIIFMADNEKFITAIREYAKGGEIKTLLEKSEGGKNIEPLFAAVCIASEKSLGQVPYDSQLLAARALTEGKIIEMPTGEGKTLAAVFAAAWHKMRGRKTHILTFNDYLAHRDRNWMKPVYDMLGINTAVITEKSDFEERRAGYECDVLYISARECCFDYLRDFTAQTSEKTVGQEFEAAIVDEADSLLIDEARIPMVVAGETDIKPDPELEEASEYVKTLCSEDYEISLEADSVYLTDEGASKAEEHYNIENMYDEENSPLLSKINDCLKAQFLLQEDRDYISRDGKILLIDKFTGRVAENRHYPGALQSAVELKHGVKVTTRGIIMGSIALQYFVRRYEFLSAMTGTAEASKEEFYQIYDMLFEKIEPHVPSQRTDHDMEIYYDTDSKRKGVVKAIKEAHQKNQPILVGTGSISDSETLAALLKEEGIDATVLNAKNDSEEAEIISNAGALGAVTISTNMAGRGVDIRLGGADEKTRDEVVEAGGLLVISTYMPESSRIVQQLLGRSGRQGDVGETRSFVSVDEPIMERCKLNSLLPPKHIPQPTAEAIEDKVLFREVERVQRISEGDSFDARCRLLKFTMIGEKHREQIFEARSRILRGKSPNIWKDFEGFKEAEERVGGEKLEELEKKTAVAAANRFWSDYLEYTEQLRRGIHLMEVSGRSPSEEYNIIVEEYYQGMEQELKAFMGEQLELLLEKGEEGYVIEIPKNIHTYLLEDTGDELNKLPFLFNVFDEEEENPKPKKAEKKAPSILEEKVENDTEKEPKKKGFLFFKKKK